MKNITFFKNKIMQWGEKYIRSFSWRINTTPYKVLISELLLQRTTSTQVEGIFPKFIKKYPNVKVLFKTEEDKLLEFIKPLGLYKRRLKAFNKFPFQLKEQFNFIIPRNFKDLSSLFGVGDYIANAVLCFAFNERTPIVDTNIIRIFQRFFGFQSEKKYIESDKRIWDLAEILLPERNFKTYNYSILDFGNLICKASSPKCLECPLSIKCKYFKKQKET